jgi:hypothetical protein
MTSKMKTQLFTTNALNFNFYYNYNYNKHFDFIKVFETNCSTILSIFIFKLFIT